MSAVMGQVTAPTSPSTVRICTVPPGAKLHLHTVDATADVFIGTTSTVTSSTGCPLDPSGPDVVENPVNGAPFDVYACAGTGTHLVGFILTTPG